MSEHMDRMLAAALGRTEQLFAAEAELGELAYVDGEGCRVYQRQAGPDFHLTVVEPSGSSLRYELVGVSGGAL